MSDRFLKWKMVVMGVADVVARKYSDMFGRKRVEGGKEVLIDLDWAKNVNGASD